MYPPDHQYHRIKIIWACQPINIVVVRINRLFYSLFVFTIFCAHSTSQRQTYHVVNVGRRFHSHTHTHIRDTHTRDTRTHIPVINHFIIELVHALLTLYVIIPYTHTPIERHSYIVFLHELFVVVVIPDQASGWSRKKNEGRTHSRALNSAIIIVPYSKR